MDWIEFASRGGGWGIAVLVGAAVYIGKLRLDREFVVLEKQLSDSKAKEEALAQELRTTTMKAEEALRAEQAANRAELAELRKTNAAMVSRILGKDAT